ncbi:MAG TPA: anti-sigma factor [Nitrospira sp.]|nr:anti-sigma factor [Nitrospira sp.]
MALATESDQDGARLLVHAYLDGELDVANGLAVKQKIDTDSNLAAEAADIQELKALLRGKFPSEPLPSHLKQKIDSLHRQVGRTRRPAWGSMAAAILVAIALSNASTWFVARIMTSSTQTSELVDSHLRSLIAPQPTDVASSDRHTVKPWFNGKVAQSPRVKDLSEAGFPLLGGRVDVLQKVAVPTLVYRRRLHVISVTSAPTAVSGTADDVINGFNIVRWDEEGMSYWAISDLNPAELNEFARLYRQRS